MEETQIQKLCCAGNIEGKGKKSFEWIQTPRYGEPR